MPAKRMLYAIPLVVLLALFALTIGCSNSSPVVPGNLPDNIQPSQAGAESANHSLWGDYLLTLKDVLDENGNVIDIAAEIIPNKTSQVHVDVTGFVKPPKCGDCVKVLPGSYTPGDPWSQIILTISLTNPTNILGHDVRGIIYPPNDEVTDTPMVRLESLDHEVRHDGLTTLYNQGMPETLNPYMAFNIETPLRPFEGHATHMAGYTFLKNNSYQIVTMPYKIDASWPGNAGEAVSCYVAPIEGPIYPNGSNAWIFALVTDWQNESVSTVSLDLTNLGVAAPVQMDKISEDPVNFTSTWQYLLTEGGGNPSGFKSIYVTATDKVETVKYFKEHIIEVTYDTDPPIWQDGNIGIYDHIAGPQYVWLFFYEAWDISLPLQYVFWGNTQPPPFDGTQLKVVTNENYEGYTAFGAGGGAPDNEKRWFGIRLIDGQGIPDDVFNEYSCTRHSADYKWSLLKGQPPGQDGIFGSPALGDVNGDGVDDIVVGTRDKNVYVFGGSGTGTQDTTIWKYTTGAEIQCTPALVDLNDDDKLDVVIASDDMNIYALNGDTGLPLWYYDAHVDIQDFLMHASPSICYLNGDAIPDIVIGTGGGTMLALRGDGPTVPGDQTTQVIWKYEVGQGIAGTSGVVDVTGDDIPDVCFGAYDTKVHMVNGATGLEEWFYYVGPGMNNIDCSPVMVDINGDGVPDCVIGGRDNTSELKGTIFAINGATGDELWVNGMIWGNPRRAVAPAQIDDDGVMDFLVTSYQTEQISVYAISGVDGSMIYNRLSPDIDPDTSFNYSAPVTADYTGDGHVNVMYGRQDGFVDLVNVADLDYPGNFGGKILFNMQVSSGSKAEIFADPATGDVNGDGNWDLVCCNMRGFVYIIDMNARVPDDVNLRLWPQHSGNRWNTGIPGYEPPQ